MKRIALLLLSLLLLVGCVGAGAQAAGLSPLQAPSDPPASTPEPQHDGPFLSYHFYEQPNWESITSGTLFSCDLDQDGQEEPVTFQLRPNDEWATAITWNGKTTIIDGGEELVSAEVLDLDPVSQYCRIFNKGSRMHKSRKIKIQLPQPLKNIPADRIIADPADTVDSIADALSSQIAQQIRTAKNFHSGNNGTCRNIVIDQSDDFPIQQPQHRNDNFRMPAGSINKNSFVHVYILLRKCDIVKSTYGNTALSLTELPEYRPVNGPQE